MYNSEAIQRVQSLYSNGVQSDNTRLSSRHIYNVLCGLRATLLSQEDKKNQRISDFAYQTLNCIELIEVPVNECPCTPQPGCTILRSKYEIPALIYSKSKAIFQVSGLSGKLVFTETTFETMKYKGGNRFTRHSPDYFIRNKYLYLTVVDKLKTVTARGIFADPIDAYLFIDSCSVNNDRYKCKSYLTFEFPYEEDLMSPLIELASLELIDKFTRRRQDRRNNSQDDEEARNPQG